VGIADRSSDDCDVMKADRSLSWATVTSSGREAMLAPKLVGDVEGDFYVPAYQRGYRWGPDEVGRLLDDIWESRDEPYYLQPVVVKQYGDEWELVDGQQRLTTLFLIFQYMRKEGLQSAGAGYSIRYETRPESAAYMHRLDPAQSRQNLDFFHLFVAYKCISEWFEGHGHRRQHVANKVYDSFFERVKLIWYEAPDDVDATTLFTRLNVGRIPLTDAELVKALLLSRSREVAGTSDRAREIAAQWDTIERDLRNPELWAFVTGEASVQATHIGLLLDTLAGGPTGRERPLFHTFESLRHRIDGNPQEFWNDVVDLHSLLLGWYEDRSLFHKVGFLIAQGTLFADLIALSRGRAKSQFESQLDALIRQSLSLSEPELVELSYATDAKTSRALLLMNVETLRRRGPSTERYSFREHAIGRWSLEHIHAQNAEQLNRAEQWQSWLSLQRDALLLLDDIDADRKAAVLARVEEVLGHPPVKQADFRPLERDLIDLLSARSNRGTADADSIANLALLDGCDNSAFSNSVFAVKRAEMIERDRDGSYIPVCTRNVFLKYYTQAGEQQMHFWSDVDRQHYLAAMQEVLRPYLVSEEASS